MTLSLISIASVLVAPFPYSQFVAIATSTPPSSPNNENEFFPPLTLTDITVSDPDHRNMSISQIKAEQPLAPFTIGVTILDSNSEQELVELQSFTLVMEVRDQDGVTIYIRILNQTITADHRENIAIMDWQPFLSGKYDIRYMALSSLHSPQILSSIVNKEIIVVGNSHCDPSLWNHVYNPPRLQIVYECVAITGIASFISTNENDGDEHVGIRPDAEYAHLVNEENKKRHNGAVLGEVICHTPPIKPAPQKACEGYENNVNIPPRWSYIRMTGAYVLDKQHNLWGEIHPITSIVVLEQE